MEHPASSPTKTSPPQVFETHNLALAAFLIAGRHLLYRSTHVEAGRATFVFEDLDGRGPKLEGEFLSGAECPATLFHSTVKRLRREIDEAIARDGGR